MAEDRTPPVQLSVWRNGLGPLPGIRRGNVAAYEFDVAMRWFTHHAPPPEHPVRQRAFVLIDERVQLNQPVVFPESHRGWWYVDLVSLADRGSELLVTDDYLDVIVGPPNRPYRVLDMDEYAAALASGRVTTAGVVAGLVAFQRFLDTHLNAGWTLSDHWPDFPPAAIDGLRDEEIVDPHGWAAAAARE